MSIYEYMYYGYGCSLMCMPLRIVIVEVTFEIVEHACGVLIRWCWGQTRRLLGSRPKGKQTHIYDRRWTTKIKTNNNTYSKFPPVSLQTCFLDVGPAARTVLVVA